MRSIAPCLAGATATLVSVVCSAHAQGPVASDRTPTVAAQVSTSLDPLARRIAVHFVDVPLSRVLATIAGRSQLRLTYSSDDLARSGRVSLDTMASAGETLQIVLAATKLHAVVMPDGGVVLTTRNSQRSEGQDSSGTVTGVLVARDDGQPVQYGTVLVVETDQARFTDADGHFRITRLVPGTYTLRTRQIGYLPKDTTIRVDPAPVVTTVIMRMVRLPPLLGLVKVQGRRSKRCVATGIPDSAVDPNLAAIFTQVRENVDRFRLLVDQYPFRYAREERMVLRRYPGGDSTEWADTAAYQSGARRPYRVGGIIFVDSGATMVDTILPRVSPQEQVADQLYQVPKASAARPRRKVVRDSLGDSSFVEGFHRRYMYLPTFRDLADPAFLSAHCFATGATRSTGRGNGPQLIRIDFRPASAITTPDVEGSIYLDAQRFVVRRAVFR